MCICVPKFKGGVRVGKIDRTECIMLYETRTLLASSERDSSSGYLGQSEFPGALAWPCIRGVTQVNDIHAPVIDSPKSPSLGWLPMFSHYYYVLRATVIPLTYTPVV